jgi:hypothetical protein
MAWRLVLPPSGMFTHLTAAAEYGWWLPPLPDDIPVFASTDKRENRPERPGLRISRLIAPPDPVYRDGVPLAPPGETLLACARDLGLLDLVVLCDAAKHFGCRTDDLLPVQDRRRGAPMLQRALAYADGRSESAWESVLRMLHVVCKVPVEPQYELFDEHDLLIARGDLLICGTSTIHEYDGGDHLRRPRQRKDLARLRRLGHAGYTRRGYTSHDVLWQGVSILRAADASLGRPHRPQRIRAWHALLAQSLFTARGTELRRIRWGLPPRANRA